MTASKQSERTGRTARTERRPFITNIRIEPTGEDHWKATEPAADSDLWGRGETPPEAVEHYAQLVQASDSE